MLGADSPLGSAPRAHGSPLTRTSPSTQGRPALTHPLGWAGPGCPVVLGRWGQCLRGGEWAGRGQQQALGSSGPEEDSAWPSYRGSRGRCPVNRL